MEKFKTYLDYSFRVFDIATMKGIYLLLFLGALSYWMIGNRESQEKTIQKLVITCVVAIALLLSPLLGAFAGDQVDTRVLRLYWTVPFEFVVLYCVVNVLYQLEKPSKKAAFICVIAFGLIALSRQDNLTYPKVEQKWPWIKAENLYKVPQSVYELCNQIEKKENWQGCKAAFPFELCYYVRQYDASIEMPYGYYWEVPDDPTFAAINADEVDLNEVETAAIERDLNYIVLEKDKITQGVMKYYVELETISDESNTYVLYQRRK